MTSRCSTNVLTYDSIMARRDRKDVEPLRLDEIAELLGVTKQRVHQIAGEPGFPAPIAQDLRGRIWDRRAVTAWAKVWRAERPWR